MVALPGRRGQGVPRRADGELRQEGVAEQRLRRGAGTAKPGEETAKASHDKGKGKGGGSTKGKGEGKASKEDAAWASEPEEQKPQPKAKAKAKA